MKNASRKYQKIRKSNIDLISESVSLEKAVKNIDKLAYTDFTSSVELHINLTPKIYKDKTFKGSLIFPHSTGKEIRVIAFTTSKKKAKKAKELGAIKSGGKKLIKEVEDGFNDFDVAIAEPDLMPEIAKLGKILGPQGLMPNPKNGTVTEDIAKAVENFMEGKITFKADKGGSIHLLVGKVDMKTEDLEENIRKAVDSIVRRSKKPIFNAIDSIYLAPTMGPSVEVTTSSF